VYQLPPEERIGLLQAHPHQSMDDAQGKALQESRKAEQRARAADAERKRTLEVAQRARTIRRWRDLPICQRRTDSDPILARTISNYSPHTFVNGGARRSLTSRPIPYGRTRLVRLSDRGHNHTIMISSTQGSRPLAAVIRRPIHLDRQSERLRSRVDSLNMR
jgi:hypothetical protein